MSSTAQVMLKEGKNELRWNARNSAASTNIRVDRVQKINTNVYNPAENSIKTNVSRDQERTAMKHLIGNNKPKTFRQIVLMIWIWMRKWTCSRNKSAKNLRK